MESGIDSSRDWKQNKEPFFSNHQSKSGLGQERGVASERSVQFRMSVEGGRGRKTSRHRVIASLRMERPKDGSSTCLTSETGLAVSE